MPGAPPPPSFKQGDQPPPPPTFETVTAPIPQTLTNPPAGVADQLRAKGGRTFTSGTLWVARFEKLQEVGKTEDEAASKLLSRLT